jgi:hypothetical protein
VGLLGHEQQINGVSTPALLAVLIFNLLLLLLRQVAVV